MARQRAEIVTAGSDLRGHSGTGVKKLLTCSLLPCRLAQSDIPVLVLKHC